MDSDDQFMLIESADKLDEWMDPEVMNNRVIFKLNFRYL